MASIISSSPWPTSTAPPRSTPACSTPNGSRRRTTGGSRHRGFDPVTIAVAGRAALDDWSRFLDQHGIEHSPVITSIQSWLIVLEDPDGHRLRLYSLETHGPELAPDEDNPWL